MLSVANHSRLKSWIRVFIQIVCVHKGRNKLRQMNSFVWRTKMHNDYEKSRLEIIAFHAWTNWRGQWGEYFRTKTFIRFIRLTAQLLLIVLATTLFSCLFLKYFHHISPRDVPKTFAFHLCPLKYGVYHSFLVLFLQWDISKVRGAGSNQATREVRILLIIFQFFLDSDTRAFLAFFQNLTFNLMDFFKSHRESFRFRKMFDKYS